MYVMLQEIKLVEWLTMELVIHLQKWESKNENLVNWLKIYKFITWHHKNILKVNKGQGEEDEKRV